jgi:hypothetical protein
MLCGEVRTNLMYYTLKEELSSSFAGGSPTSRPSGVRSRGGAGMEVFFRRQRRNATSKPTTTGRTVPKAMPILAPVESPALAPELFDIVVEVETDNPVPLVEFERSTALPRVGSETSAAGQPAAGGEYRTGRCSSGDCIE